MPQETTTTKPSNPLEDKRSSLLQTQNQTFGCFDHRSPIYQHVVAQPYGPLVQKTPQKQAKTRPQSNRGTPAKTRQSSIASKIMTPEYDRVIHEYRVLETGYRAKQPPNTILNGSRHLIPRKLLEVEKENYDLCKLGKDEVAYKDIARVEIMARKSSRFFTREVFEKNIMPEQ